MGWFLLHLRKTRKSDSCLSICLPAGLPAYAFLVSTRARLSLSSDRVLSTQLLELAAFPSVAAKVPVVLSMIVSLVGPLLLDRLCVKLFDPELHSARKAEPPLGTVVRNGSASSLFVETPLQSVRVYPGLTLQYPDIVGYEIPQGLSSFFFCSFLFRAVHRDGVHVCLYL